MQEILRRLQASIIIVYLWIVIECFKKNYVVYKIWNQWAMKEKKKTTLKNTQAPWRKSNVFLHLWSIQKATEMKVLMNQSILYWSAGVWVSENLRFSRASDFIGKCAVIVIINWKIEKNNAQFSVTVFHVNFEFKTNFWLSQKD